MAIVTGVLPAPPTNTDPTQSTGAGARSGGAEMASRRREAAIHTADKGSAAFDSNPGVGPSQKAGARSRSASDLILVIHTRAQTS